jgi:hypothetical protein
MTVILNGWREERKHGMLNVTHHTSHMHNLSRIDGRIQRVRRERLVSQREVAGMEQPLGGEYAALHRFASARRGGS